MSLRHELAEHLSASQPHLSLAVDGDDWELYVLGLSRIGRDSFVQMALVGPRFCTVMARVPAAQDSDAKARTLIALVLRWLGTETRATQAFLESPECATAIA